MARREQPATFSSDYGCTTPIFEEDSNDEKQLPYLRFNQEKQQGSAFRFNHEARCRLGAALLALLAAVLLIVNIGLGVHYSNIRDTHLTLDDTKKISEEMDKIKETYSTAIKNMNLAKKQLTVVKNQKTQINWEIEHQRDRDKDYKLELGRITTTITTMSEKLSLTNNSCKYCPPGWILMNSVCFYFSFSDSDGLKTWQDARAFCQLHEGDLIIIDTKDKQNATVTHLLKNYYSSKSTVGFWIGLRDNEAEGTWKWLDGTVLVEGFWNYGEPNNARNEDCAAVYGLQNFFRSWNDNRCTTLHRWICEKAPKSAS